MSRPSTVPTAILLLVVLASRLSAQEHAHARGAEQLGTVHFATSCRPSVAPTFDRGMALLHSFEFGGSIGAFNELLASDSSCAMAYWGIALSRWSNPMTAGARTPKMLEPGRQAANAAARIAANAAARLAPGATERERGYIGAVGQLYADYEHRDQRTRIVAYEKATHRHGYQGRCHPARDRRFL